MLKQTSTVALLLTTLAIAAAMSPGCGGSSARPTGTAGTGGGTAGEGTAGAGTAGAGTAGAGTAGEGTAGAGTAGAGAAGAGVDGGSAGVGTAGAGTAGAGTAGAAPPVVTATTAVIEIDDVIVSLKSSGADAGVDADAADGEVADGSVDGSSDGAVSEGGVDAGDAASDVPTGPLAVGVSYTFDTSALGLDGWHYTGYGSTPTTDPNGAENLATTSTLVWSGTDDADGKSTSGVIKGTVQFKYLGDQIDFQAFSQATGKYDWTGFVITAKVKLVSGGNLAYGCPLSASIYVSDSNGYTTRNSATVNSVTGGWVTVTYDLADATTAGIQISSITQMGLQINTGTDPCVGTTPPDASADGPADGPADGGASETDGGDAALEALGDSAGN
jgi:hypothetical protein